MTANPAFEGFEYLGSETIQSLNLEVQTFRHQKTGAQHIHLVAEDSNNVFMVAFPTVPQDSTGVAHILEHTALCGSERFPVRDPFFMMTRRSLNTFMNAFTSSDWTAYPFASQNRKDFHNLLDVYLDAAFFPTLEALDFAQEGHRVEFAEADNPESELVYKGVVFNEMKGAMSSSVRALWDELSKNLFPTITYHHNSGGDPEAIPDLTHEQLKAFHARHYHPSNAIFLTYGDMPAKQHQAEFEQKVLQRFERLELEISVPDETRMSAPIRVQERYALDGEEETQERTHILLGWLLGHSIDIEEALASHLLSGVLLDNSASPLRHALETTELGSAPSPLCGLDDANREMVFACGLEGSEPERVEAVEQLILDVLNDVAENGVDPALVESMLHQLELSQREIGGDGYPYGLQLMLSALPSAIHGGDPAKHLNIDPVLEGLRAKIQDPEFIKGLVRTWLLDNPHRVTVVFSPDTQLSEQRAQAEAARLAAIKAGLNEQARADTVRLTQALEARQQQQDDPDILPQVTLDDVPDEIDIPEWQETEIADRPCSTFIQGTNGLVYQQVIVDLPELSPELFDLLPLYSLCTTEMGSAGRDYRTTQALQAQVTGGLSASATLHGLPNSVFDTRAVFVLSGKALARNQAALGELLQETFCAPRFDEYSHLRELVTQTRMQAEQGVTDNGHGLAMLAACSGMAPSAQIAHRWRGLAGLQAIKALDKALTDDDELEALSDRLTRIQRALADAPRQFLLVGEEGAITTMAPALSQTWAGMAPGNGQAAASGVEFTPQDRQTAWITSTQVNFCSRAFATVPSAHADAPALMVLSGFLRNGFLHRTIREQGGAYGGGANFEGDSGTFRFYSYRDPRFSETLQDFEASIQWLLESKHEARTLEEAVLGVISRIDQPGSPAGDAKGTFHSNLYGRTPEHRRRFRSRVLQVSMEDLRRVGETYLHNKPSNTAVICSPTSIEANRDLGLEEIHL